MSETVFESLFLTFGDGPGWAEALGWAAWCLRRRSHE